MEEKVEIIDIQEEIPEVSKTLRTEKEKRNLLLAETSKTLKEQAQSIQDYQTLEKEYKLLEKKSKQLKKDLTKSLQLLETQNKDYQKLLHQEEKAQLQHEKLIQKNQKLQEFLQILIDHYGIKQVSAILGIPYIQIKKYLQD